MRRSTGCAAAVAELRRNPRVTLLPRTTAFGYFPHNFIGLAERLTDHLADAARATCRASACGRCAPGRVVLATGAIERPLVFPGNDRPGIMLAGAAQTYLNRYGVRVGDRVVVVTACDAAYQAALDLQAAGVDRRRRRRSARRSRRRAAGGGARRRHRGARGVDACSAPRAICASRRSSLGEVDADGTRARRTRRLDCDAVLMSRRIHAERASVLPVARQARLGRVAAGLRAGPLGGARALRRRVPRRHRSRRRRWRTARPPARRRPDSSAPIRRRSAAVARFARRSAIRRATARILGALPARRPAEQAQGLRRFAERRDRARPAARRARRLPLDRARQALHHHRHGDRPGQDLEPERARPSSPQDLERADSRRWA